MSGFDLTTRLLPVLGRSLDVGFNVFDVMHHGTHEKQLSNVFRWLLDIGGTHNFAELGQGVLIELLNEHRPKSSPLPTGLYKVRQEVNTSQAGEAGDIADIVLENDEAVIVIENYESSDGHGHGYRRYLRYSEQNGKLGAVVLLCVTEDATLRTDGWELAATVTYERFLRRLVQTLDRNRTYAVENGPQHQFIHQMHEKYASGGHRMSDRDVLDFVTALCATGEAKRYQERDQEVAAERFANDLAQQARESFGEGREVLQRVKSHLKLFATNVLVQQLNGTLGEGFVGDVSARFSGIYQWTVNLETQEAHESFGEARLQIKFGPSAWFANEQDSSWKHTVPPATADYARLFLTRAKNHEIRQSVVSLREVLQGLANDDARLHDEIAAMIRAS